MRKSAEIDTDLDTTLPPVPCIVSAINQVILNLIVNAAHAIADITENSGKGTGQGLAIARAIITETHHGSIEFESNPGCVTTFIIRLPLNKTGGVS